MGIICVARNRAFWLMDAVKGSPVRTAYNTIKKIDEMDSGSAYIQRHQEEAWQILKEKACSKTRAYRSFKDCSFDKFPVISKQDIRASQDDYISSDFNKKDLIQMATSGSTGTPFICYQNSGKKRRVNAEIIYYSGKAGYRLGDNLSYIRSIVRQNKKSKLKQFLQNQTLIDCSKLSDSGVESLIAILKSQSQKGRITLLGYGSTYTAIKDYCVRHHIDCFDEIDVRGVISGSDMLYDETRAIISKVFGYVPVVSRYSNEENGVLGQDEGLNNIFTINEANYIIEIVDDEGNAVEDGTLGRIVVTDLYNYAMPMIRYDTGDVGAIQLYKINGRKKRCICQFSGRRVDLISDANGSAISPHTITNLMWSFPEITQFQLIQKGKTLYTLRLNVDGQITKKDEIIDSLRKVLGDLAQIDVEQVNEIPVLASGKRRYIVNECKLGK